MKTDPLLLDQMRSVLEAEGLLEAKAQRISQMIRLGQTLRLTGLIARKLSFLLF